MPWQTTVKGRTIVVGKNCKAGDLMFYCSNQSQLNEGFLSINNLYQDYEHNANADEVTAWLKSHQTASEQEINDYKRKHRGYFNSKSQVRMTKLARILFDDSRRLIRFDMTEYANPESLSLFRKELTARIWERPYSIILLDEIEKACAEVMLIIRAPRVK